MAIHPHARARLVKWLLLFVFLAVAITAVVLWRNGQANNKAHPAPTGSTSSSVETTPVPTLNKNQYSVNDSSSLWAVVNKGRILPSSYAPANLTVPKVTLGDSAASDNMHLRQEAATAVEDLITAAGSANAKLKLVSGYRSYGTQQSVYSGYVNSQGQAYADSTSARPGHSEHQTGLAADLGATSGKCQLEACFGDTVEGKWLADNAYKYGFIIRYQKDKASLTGYTYEPWHLRYVGTDFAEQLSKTGQTLEQFFGLPAYGGYPATIYQLSHRQ